MLKFNNYSLLFLSVSAVCVKIAAFVIFRITGFNFFDGNDSNYYHAYAIGNTSNAVNVWPEILRFLNDSGVYDRSGVAYFMFFLNLVVIPFLIYRVSIFKDVDRKQRTLLVTYFFLAAYPTLFFFSLDIFRDLVMVAIFLLSLLFIKRYFYARFAVFSLIVFLSLCYVAFLFRPYLGAAMALSYVIFYFYSKTSRYLFFWILLYFSGLAFGQFIGIFDAITAYRGVDGFENGGAGTMGIGLHGRDPVTFIGLYCYSFLAQVLGLFFPNFSSVLVFLIESLPFSFAFYFVFKNRRFMNPFCHYLLVFFVVYTTVWVIGNDNIGTAVRLRMPSYLAIFICFIVISQIKRCSLGGLQL